MPDLINEYECTIDGESYPVARDKGKLLFFPSEMGEELVEEYKTWHLGLGYTDADPLRPGYFTGTGIDGTMYGQLRRGIGTTFSATHAANVTDFAYYFEATSGGSNYVYLAVGQNVYRYGTSGGTLYATSVTVVGGVAGRPANWGGAWYVPFGGAVGAMRLDYAVGPDTWVAQTWRAYALSTFMQAGVSKIARAHGTNLISVATAVPLATADPGSWSGNTGVGSVSHIITDITENQGLLFVGKVDNLYEFDADNIARPVLPAQPYSADNGKGMLAFGDTIFYPAISGLWRYKIGAGGLTVGPDVIRAWGDTENPAAILGGTHSGLTSVGEWIYAGYNNSDGLSGTVLVGRVRREDDPPGSEMIWHTPIINAMPIKGVYAASDARVWCRLSGLVSNKELIVLGHPSGCPGLATTREAVNLGSMAFGETTFRAPTKRKQLIAAYVDCDATGAGISLLVHRDGNVSESVGTISVANTTTTLTWTPGTNDKCFRVRPVLQINNASGDATRIRRVVLVARTPTVYTVVIPADDARLEQYGLTAEDALQNLMRLVNRGPITIEEPARHTSWQGYIEGVKSVTFTDPNADPTRVQYGLEVTVNRYTTDGN